MNTLAASAGTLFLYTLEYLLNVYLLILLIRVTFAWFPNVEWYKQPFYSILMLADPYLKLFRGIVPQVFGIDLSMIFGFIFIQSLIELLQGITIR